MAKTKMSSKGQVVIPKDIRDAVQWEPGAELDVVETDEGVLLRRAGRFPGTTLDQLVGCTGYRGQRVSLAEMDSAVDSESRRRR